MGGGMKTTLASSLLHSPQNCSTLSMTLDGLNPSDPAPRLLSAQENLVASTVVRSASFT